MRAMKEALKKQREREKARAMKGQAEKPAEIVDKKRKRKLPIVLTDVLERPSSEERAVEEDRASKERAAREKSSLEDLAGTLDRLAEEFGQLALRQAMERKFAELPSSGQGMSKKQLNQIILDKNRVIADLEETAYTKGKGMSKSNPWISHVKAYAKDNGITYSQAMKQAKSTYKK
jgi:hypothetical protein